jgi:hypothetical protein
VARGGWNKKTEAQYKEQIKPLGIELLEPYISDGTKVRHKCVCGNDNWIVQPNHVINGHKCGCTKGGQPSTDKEYLQKLKMNEINLKPKQKYVNSITPILHQCNVCGYEWYIAPAQVIRGVKCQCQTISIGESKIMKYLDKKDIDYEFQYSFSGFHEYKNAPYRYDFAIMDQEQVIALIEYQGAQHFEYSEHWHRTKEYFLKCQKRDQIKRAFAKRKGIPLIEITYKHKEPIQALETELKALGIRQLPKRKYV